MNMAEAAAALADVLRQENHALLHNDLPTAGRLLTRKQDVVRAFTDAARAAPGAPVPHVARELPELAETNRRLLERAMAVQRQVIGLVARSATGAGAPAGRYGRTGAHLRAPTDGRALMSRA